MCEADPTGRGLFIGLRAQGERQKMKQKSNMHAAFSHVRGEKMLCLPNYEREKDFI